MLLEKSGLKTTTEVDDSLSTPRESVIVLAGDLNSIPPRFWPHLETFLRRGGAVLVMSDRRCDLKQMCLVEPGPVEALVRSRSYQDWPDCLRVTSLAARHPLMRGVHQLVTNRCGWVSRIWKHHGRWDMLAYLPRGAQNNRGEGGGRPLIASLTMRDSPGGRMLVMADHSLLINGMLWHGDNAMLAVNVSDWLTADNRSRLLFLLDGRPVPAGPSLFDALPPGSLPPASFDNLPELPRESMIAFTNSFIAGLEDADVLNEFATTLLGELTQSQYRRWLMLLFGVIAGLFVLRQLARGGRSIERPPDRTPSSVSEMRIRDLLHSGVLRPATRELACELFRSLTGSDNPDHWKLRPQDVQVRGGLLLQMQVRSALSRLLKIATNVDRTWVSKREFRYLARRIELIHALHAEGRLVHPWFHDVASESRAGLFAGS